MFWAFPFLFVGVLVTAESYEVDSAQLQARESNDGELCFVWGHRVALLGDTLWFTHGNYSFLSGDVNSPQPYLFSLAINSKTPVESTISASIYQRYDLPGNPNIAYNTEDTQTVLWYNNDSLFSVFTTQTERVVPWEMSMFSTTKDGQYPLEWGPANVVPARGPTGADLGGGNVSVYSEWGSEASVSVPDSGLSFSFGGSPQSEALPGLITFNASYPWYSYITWWNNTSPGSSGVSVPLVAESEMVYVPYGKEGVLLMMGGYSKNGSGNAVNNDMSQISVYDIATTNWYVVTTSGTAPPGRRQFCAVVSAAADQSSFQVSIFGGFDGVETDLEDVWVLSVPSFTWINVTSDSLKNDAEAASTPVSIGRSHHRCAIYNNRQMIVLGGSVHQGPGAVPVNETGCQGLYPPIRVLDTTTYTWKKTFDMSLSYTVPTAVTQVIGGNGQGGALMKGPTKPFNDTALNAIFASPISTVAPKTSSTPSQSPTPTPKPKSSTGAVAGGVVAGIAILGLIVGAAFFGLRRKKRANEMKGKGGAWGGESSRSLGPKYSMINEGEEGDRTTSLPDISRRHTGRQDHHSEERSLGPSIELSGW